MRVTLRNFLWDMFRPVSVLVWLLLTVTAAVMGPFNTLTLMEPAPRILYWGVLIFLARAISTLLVLFIARIVPDRRSWGFDGLHILAMTVVFSPVVDLWTRLMLSHRGQHLPHFLRICLFVALISAVVHTSKRVMRADNPGFLRQEDGALRTSVALEQAEMDSPVQTEPGPRLMRRLPDNAVGPVLRLSARDHFVEVVLPEATHSLRMRFTDAIHEMDGIEGYCAHRSHWVVRSAIVGIERDRSRIFLRLCNGDQVPVSRTYRPRLEQAGIV